MLLPSKPVQAPIPIDLDCVHITSVVRATLDTCCLIACLRSFRPPGLETFPRLGPALPGHRDPRACMLQALCTLSQVLIGIQWICSPFLSCFHSSRCCSSGAIWTREECGVLGWMFGSISSTSLGLPKLLTYPHYPRIEVGGQESDWSIKGSEVTTS